MSVNKALSPPQNTDALSKPIQADKTKMYWGDEQRLTNGEWSKPKLPPGFLLAIPFTVRFLYAYGKDDVPEEADVRANCQNDAIVGNGGRGPIIPQSGVPIYVDGSGVHYTADFSRVKLVTETVPITGDWTNVGDNWKNALWRIVGKTSRQVLGYPTLYDGLGNVLVAAVPPGPVVITDLGILANGMIDNDGVIQGLDETSPTEAQITNVLPEQYFRWDAEYNRCESNVAYGAYYALEVSRDGINWPSFEIFL